VADAPQYPANDGDWTFDLALSAVTGGSFDITTPAAPADGWFTWDPQLNTDTADAWFRLPKLPGTAGGDKVLYAVNLNKNALDAWTTAVSNISSVMDEVLKGNYGQMSAESLYDLSQLVDTLAHWLDLRSGDFHKFATDISAEGSAFKGSAAFVIDQRLTHYGDGLNDLHTQMTATNAGGVPTAIRNAYTALSNFGIAMDKAYYPVAQSLSDYPRSRLAAALQAVDDHVRAGMAHAPPVHAEDYWRAWLARTPAPNGETVDVTQPGGWAAISTDITTSVKSFVKTALDAPAVQAMTDLRSAYESSTGAIAAFVAPATPATVAPDGGAGNGADPGAPGGPPDPGPPGGLPDAGDGSPGGPVDLATGLPGAGGGPLGGPVGLAAGPLGGLPGAGGGPLGGPVGLAAGPLGGLPGAGGGPLGGPVGLAAGPLGGLPGAGGGPLGGPVGLAAGPLGGPVDLTAGPLGGLPSAGSGPLGGPVDLAVPPGGTSGLDPTFAPGFSIGAVPPPARTTDRPDRNALTGPASGSSDFPGGLDAPSGVVGGPSDSSSGTGGPPGGDRLAGSLRRGNGLPIDLPTTSSGLHLPDLQPPGAAGGPAGGAVPDHGVSGTVSSGLTSIGSPARLEGLTGSGLPGSGHHPGAVGLPGAAAGSGVVGGPVSAGLGPAELIGGPPGGLPGAGGSGDIMGGAGLPFLPPMVGGAGGAGQKPQERERQSWLAEDEDAWGTDFDAATGVVGRFDDVEGLDRPLATAKPGQGRPQPAVPRRDGADVPEQTAVPTGAN
jgi:hypothetical protein